MATKPAPLARAEPTPLPAQLEPELATLVDKPRPGDWIYEIKLDGYRMLARIGSAKDVRIFTRRGNDWSARFPALVKELARQKLPPGWYDGEIVMLDDQGLPDFNALQLAIDGGKNADIVFYLFDAPFMDALDMRRVPVEERRARLESVLRETELLRFSKELKGPAADLLKSACKLGLEGIIGKRRGSSYVHRRSDDWIKLKCTQRQEFVIGAYTWPDDSGADAGIGALLVGQFDTAGALQYAGKVGTGFTGEISGLLRLRLDAIAQPKRPFAGPTGHDRRATWVKPELVCEVAFNEWPEGRSLRHASFKGLRDSADKLAAMVTRELAKSEAPAPPAKRPPSPAQPAGAKLPTKITHGSRVIDTSSGLTKMDLVRYYDEVAQWMLPHLHARHCYVARFPEGIGGTRIFQQHPEGMKGLRGTDPALWPGHEPAISIESTEDLTAAAQLDVIEFHTWNSTAEAILQPDRVIFDLDPGEGVKWDEVREGALLVKAMLDEIGLESWVKTTGGKALHIHVPLLPELDYPEVKAFSHSVVLHLVRAIPQRFVAKSGAGNRVGKIFIDYLRNGQSQSTAEAFTARARPGMGVSMPIAWDEIHRVHSGAQWNIVNALDHLAKRKKDPWALYWKAKQSLKLAIATLS